MQVIESLLASQEGLAGIAGAIALLLVLMLVLLVRSRAQANRLSREADALKADARTLEADLLSIGQARDRADARIQELDAKYASIVDVDAEIASRRSALEKEETHRKQEISSLDFQIEAIRLAYHGKKETFDRLNHELAALEDRLDLADIGMYRPVLSLGSTEAYAKSLDAVQEKQKAMISAEAALVCPIKWHVDGSEAKGRTMIRRTTRLTLRAYNNECQVLIDKVSWKNFDSVKERMKKVREAFNKLNESQQVTITTTYEQLKLEELRLVYEEALKHQEEKDRIREEKEREREEAKAQRELQAEIARSEKREREREAALAEARSELAAATEAERSRYEARVLDLEVQLAKAHEQTERTKSMAEQTRVGHVYIISNKGSFGEEIFKIGMTRRLEPRDRIRELGDASVPFPFDLHALIFTEDAPALERDLHIAMEDVRVNRVNLRKEFFRAPGSRVAEIVRQRFPEVLYDEHPASQEFLGSLSKSELKKEIETEARNLLPAAI